MKTKSNPWIEWWKTEDITREPNWQKNMEIFVANTDPLLNHNSQDVILDIGCGPGYLASLLNNTVNEIHGVDISNRYIEVCRKKFKGVHGLYFCKLDENNYTDLSCLPPNKFSIIICLSVIQYFRDLDEVVKLIIQVRRVARVGAKFLLADILTSKSMLSDVVGQLMSAVKNKYLIQSLKFLYRASTTNYRKMRAANGLLILPEETLKDLIDRLSLDAQILNNALTINSTRQHLMIKF